MNPEQRLADLGLVLPPLPAAGGNYLPFRRAGSLLFLSGVISTDATGVLTGVVGADRTIDEGRRAARCCALTQLAVLRHALGTLNCVEHILSLNPDVVIQWGDKGDDIVAPLRNAGLKVILLKYGTQEDLEAWIAIFGELLGKKAEADAVLAKMADDRALVEKTAAAHASTAPRVMYLYNAPEIKVGADNSYMDFWMKLAGGKNVASGAGSGSSLGVTREQVLGWDPEVLILGNFEPTMPADVYADPKWASLSAVKNKRVYKAPIGGFSWDPPCNESNLMWLWVNSVFFPDVNHRLRERIRETYRALYAYDVTDADVDRILQMPANSGSAGYDAFRA